MTMADAEVEVPWERCSRAGCTGIKAAGGSCLAHLGARQLTTALAPLGRGRSLDARGVRIDGALLAKVVGTAPKDAEGRPSFPRTRFDGASFTPDAVFGAAVFGAEVSFDKACFEGDASFEGASFKGNVRFAQAAFAGAATFAGATFEAQAWFGGATFSGPVSFEGTDFRQLLWLGRAEFSADATFANATFTGDSTFDGARFGGRADFTGTTFNAEARLVGAQFAKDPVFKGSTFLGKGGAPHAAVRQAIWSGAGLASWPKRVAATLLDQLAATLIYLAPIPIGAGLEYGLQYRGATLVSVALGVLASLWFAVRNLIDQGRTGQTFGKRRVGISVVLEKDGHTIGVARVFLRQLAHVFDALLLVGWLWPLWNSKRQTFADKLAKTVVVKV